MKNLFPLSAARNRARVARPWLAGLVLGAASVGASAQGVPVSANFFGINYWYSQPNATITTNLKQAKVNFYRIGGNGRNKDAFWAVKENWLPTVQYVKNSLNGVPLVQLPITLTDSQVTAWVNYFKANGVLYYTIGNEPDPTPDSTGQNLTDWVNNNVPVDGFSFYAFRDRFKAIARLMKLADNNCKIIGGDFRNFYDLPISLYYSKFINDVGDEYVTVGTRKIPLLDTFSFHYYDSQGRREQELAGRFDAVQGYIDGVNTVRDGIDNTWTDLRLAVTEVNTEDKASSVWAPSGFTAGQFLATMTKLALAKRAFCVTPWSILEGGRDFSLYNTNNTRRSTMHHFAMLSENQRLNYMPGEQETNPAYSKDDLVFVGLRDATGYTVLLLNNSNTARSYTISLTNQYAGSASARIKLEGYAGVSAELRTGTIEAHKTILYRLTSTGAFESKTYYDDNDAAPVLQRPATVMATTAGQHELVSIYPNPATRSFTLDGLTGPLSLTLRSLAGQVVLQRQTEATTPIDISSLARGMYLLTATTADGRVLRQKLVKE
ncbi:T9SS type A sorting domain-containing protein [Hymenobacter lucidus]|uniref:T9SS type A sorting domain-containing protein n=1 Tax=Hymenobacter lucidus TaxID=2880930 RepID=A0ABS8ALE9_9BACT|nr:T9SS type A sorting domain-containing protein [Hymenobacter lucidus]MCB2406564.1 T9SS type A sorting domain-containing protein [Hymenobacter lucidus]